MAAREESMPSASLSSLSLGDVALTRRSNFSISREKGKSHPERKRTFCVVCVCFNHPDAGVRYERVLPLPRLAPLAHKKQFLRFGVLMSTRNSPRSCWSRTARSGTTPGARTARPPVPTTRLKRTRWKTLETSSRRFRRARVLYRRATRWLFSDRKRGTGSVPEPAPIDAAIPDGAM